MSTTVEEIRTAKGGVATTTAEATVDASGETVAAVKTSSSVKGGEGKLPETPAPPAENTVSRWWHWHEPGTSPEEKRLILKLDWFLLSYSCLCFFVKWLDGNNVSNAYVSGMQEELHFGPGNELSWMNTYFTIGQLVGAPAANLIITVVRPRYWLPFCLMTWSLFVLFLYKCNTAPQFYGLRFCIGLFESAAWPGITYTLGCWYRKSELARRSALFVISGVLGQMMSGYLQAALFTGMEGRGGMSAWRAWYLNEWERQRARERIEEEGRKPIGKLDLSVIRRIAGSWQMYAFTLGYALWTLTIGNYVMQYFTLYLKATGQFTIPQVNNIPTAIGAVNFFTMLTTGFVADKLGRRGPVCLAVGLIMIFNLAVLSAWDVPHALRMVVFIAMGVYGCFTPLLAGWVNETCGGDDQLRAFTLGIMTSVGGAVGIPFQQLQFPSSQAPHFKQTHGWLSALVFTVVLTLWTGFGIPILQKKKLGKTQMSEDRSESEVGA